MPLARTARAALALSFYILLSFPALLQAQDFSGFRIPDHRLLTWNADFAGNGSRVRHSREDFIVHNRRLDGSASSRLLSLRDSDRVRTAWIVGIAATGRAARSEADDGEDVYYSPSWGSRNDESRRTDERWNLRLEDRRYPFATALGIELTLEGEGLYAHEWRNSEGEESRETSGSIRSTIQSDRDEHVTDTRMLSVEFGIGFGRVRDATSVADAWLLEKRLRKSGAISRSLSPEARQRFVQILALRSAYSTVLDRPAKALWTEVERVIREDGALSETGIRPGSVHHAGEAVFPGGVAPDGLPNSPISRSIGFFFGPVASVRHSSNWARVDRSFYSRISIDDSLESIQTSEFRRFGRRGRDEVLAGLRGEFHLPLGEAWQIDAESRCFLPLRKEETGHEVTSKASLTWLVHDRWMIVGSITQDRVIRRGESAFASNQEGWSVAYGIGARYFVEDRIFLGFNAMETQSAGGFSPYFGDDDARSRSGSVNLQLGCQLLGRLSASDLVAPVRTPRSDANF